MSLPETINITAELIAELSEHQARTGVGPTKLLKNTRHKRPDGLRAHIISNWIEGKNKTLRKDHLEYVLKLWNSFPDGPNRIQITPKIKEELCKHRNRTGIGSHAITTISDDCPKGLTSGIIQYWLDGSIKTARKEHLDYILCLWNTLEDSCEL